MSNGIQLVMGISPPHRNQYLFSDHYLNSLLPQDPRWPQPLPESEAFLTWLQQLFAREQNQLRNYNEPQLEEHWFKPILRQLGHVFEGQTSVPGLGQNIKRPDYVFFPDDRTRQAAVGVQKTTDYTAEALAIGEVKRWNVPLGKKQKGGGASFDAQNPSWQIDYYIRTTSLDWGILSNGRMWRLVHKDTSQRLSIYYEVDLVDLLSRDDAGAALRYFSLFFYQSSFRPDTQGRIFLNDALKVSTDYTVALEEDLKKNVYQALEMLMQGFLDLPANSLGSDDLRTVYDNSLYLLYRLLFILYAESRGLLPLENEQYREHYSLRDIQNDIANDNAPTAPTTTVFWARLQTLFHIINGDDAELNRILDVPRYNGGLYNPGMHPFLEEKVMGDRALVGAIDLLCRRTTEEGREFVDYRTLGVRHLGSIYEGLLEYQPSYASEEMVAVRGSKRERWIEASQVLSGARVVDRRQPGQVFLETDKGERKTTGSYYTPQYIVEYIVENTLGPLVEEARARIKARAKGAIGKAARAAAEQSLVDEILSLKVLDPAMGSGHFLVQATDYLALALATDPYVEIEISVEEDLVYWKRRVVERCIYGVDKNPLAVELAKLSLWLSTVAADQPLCFLDLHLKCGDSLIGAKVTDVGWAPPPMMSAKMLRDLEQVKAGQINMFEHLLGQILPVMIGRILEIIEQESDTYERVQAKETVDETIRQIKAPYEAVANLWVSAYFGNEFTLDEYDQALDLIGKSAELFSLPAIETAQEIVQQRHFFHWELAFPEVFYDRTGQRRGKKAGFNVVVGNPPYISVTNIPSDDRAYLLEKYCTASGRFDAYIVFVEKSFEVLSSNGFFSFIIPIKWAIYANGRVLRDILLEEVTMNQLINISQSQIFPDPTTYPCILVISISAPPNNHRVTVVNIPKDQPELVGKGFEYWHNAGISTNVPLQWFSQTPERIISPLLNDTNWGILSKLNDVSNELGKVYRVEQLIRIGSQRKRRKLIQINPPKESADDYHPVIDGEHVRPYSINWNGQYLHYLPEELYNPKTPEILHRPKILIKRIAESLTATYDFGINGDYFYPLNTIYALIEVDEITINPLYHTALCNSKLLDWYYKLLFNAIGIRGGYIEFREFLKYLPLRHINFITPQTEQENMVTQAKELYSNGEMEMLLAFTQIRLDVDPEQADVVHDLMAHLAEQMIAMNVEKQAAIKVFWIDLEGVCDLNTFIKLRHKGKHDSTLWNTEACRPFVNESSHATRHLDESLAWSEDAFKAFIKTLAGNVQGLSSLVNMYRAHNPTYRELTSRIEASDRLIDKIVYQLYGLTEEDIAIVEGR